MIKFKIRDLQGAGNFEDCVFDTHEEVRNALIKLHKEDWQLSSDINTWTLSELLNYGSWELIRCLFADNDNTLLIEKKEEI